jgi:pimeloyl-ACP methyl ester carboxylesterase
LPDAGPKLLVLIHGLCMNDFQWSRAGHHHGEHLAHALGYTPVHLHYNTGLHISANGRLMADAMQRLLEAWPVPLERVTLLGHSMGGLVARSALHYATAAGNTSLGGESPRIDDLICLGTPHLGAPLEKAGHGVDTFLEALPFAAPLARIGRARSAGITDLREGHLIDPQVQAQGEAQARGRNMEAPAAIPLPKGTRCYAVAASLGPRSGRRSPRWLADGLGDGLGDGLVPVASALGQHADAARCLNFPSHRQHVVYGTGHLDLLSSAEVAAQLERWLR